ncbi:uncharacterized protein A1O9_08500 [Exophiala aquamarina CBS 119918]|uniref:Wax synthase domain-containing protein n=1 Tax=Exophiala aquamarina CBS 119918 TaxID=1182545 RepID=A0A072P6M2_9EURO|nr:uncharacterized protein A1O9_08500 [Exophiala aquamarina CBS 119918]KEF55749.1 hypothetical protein A1O9_08500 [Exophiala aquamarina CBS 119918]
MKASASPPPSSDSQPRLQDYLPVIALPFLPILAFTAPPFHGRGLVFAGLIITTYSLSLASPWPANVGPTRQSRYGIASAWLLVLPTLERLLLHVPERDFWRVDDVNGKDGPSGRHDEAAKAPPPPPAAWTWRKLCWATALASSPRGVGWNIASRRVSSAHEAMARQRIGRSAFVRACLGRAACAYLALDAALVVGRDLPVPAAWLWNWGTVREVVAAEGLMLVCTYASMALQFEVLAAVLVGIGLSRPEDWPPLFGSLADCYTVSNVWEKFWHTYIRLPVLGLGHFAIRQLRLPARSLIANLVILIVAFGISDFVHITSLAVIRDEALSLQELILDMSGFFMMQPVAAVAEALTIQWYHKFTSSTRLEATREASASRGTLRIGREDSHPRGKLAPTIPRIIGYLWVLCWFSVTGWGFVKAYIAVGVRDWQVPLSFWQVLMRQSWYKR